MKGNRQKGFTLIETLIYMALFSIILVITLQMFSTVFEAQIESQATSSVAVDGRYILSRFSYDINRAGSITAPVAYGVPSNTLVIVIGANNLTYSLSGGNLILNESLASTSSRLNSDNTSVSNLIFTRLSGGNDNDLVQISYTLTSDAVRTNRNEVLNFQTTSGLR